MKKVVAEKYRDIDFSRAKRGPVVKPEPGKTKISIRLDNTILEYFRDLVDRAGGGNYQTLINDALLEHVHRRSTLDAVRQVVREELSQYRVGRRLTSPSSGPAARAARSSAAEHQH
ncbi:MAG: BrnA antitoxin family protein [Candidatus Rokubacteria bacterium]|nr:BrnA antitoxin family protein [Candidatus Rokubacteria bacterium]